jgi:hypothetical protein
MSGEDFDALTEALASRTISRRRALRLAAASALGAAGLGIAAREAEARPTCPRNQPPACELHCKHSGGCRCIRTTGGMKQCVRPCCSNRTCDSNADCRKTEVCMLTDCCNGGAPTCVTRCSARRPRYCDREQATTSSSSTTTW